jgi:tRNA pseudouridine13 synthase
MKIYELDKKLGLKCYHTPKKGIGGVLRKKISDFEVHEINQNGHILQFFSHPKKYTHLIDKKLKFLGFNLQKYNLSTNAALRKISNLTGIDTRSFFYSGLKDKRAISVQNFSVVGNPIKELLKINEKDLILFNFRKAKKIYIGEHLGNYFKIIIRGIEKPLTDFYENFDDIKDKGILNYFGYQRFGTIRPISHLIGKSILKKDFESAIKKYLIIRSKHEGNEMFQIRKSIEIDWPNIDPKIINNIPDTLYFEKELVKKLVASNLDFEEIMFSTFNPNLVMLFAHAYQSFLFNNILSERFKSEKYDIKSGDYIIILDYSGLPSRKIIQVTDRNFRLLKRLVNKKMAVLGIPLIGANVSKDKILEQYDLKSVLIVEDLDLSDLKFNINQKIEILGGFRPAFVFPDRLDYKIFINKTRTTDNKIEIKFSLPKGTYATILLREIMKSDPFDY